MASETHPMSRRERIRAATEAGTLDSLPVDLMREELVWRQSAGLLTRKGDAGKMSKAEIVAALGGPAAPEATPTRKEK